jgi:hypothetical protein
MLAVSMFLIRKETGKVFLKKMLELRLFSSYKEKWGEHIDTLYDELPSVKDLVYPLLVSIVGWIVWFSEIYLISQLFNIHLPYFDFILVVAVTNVIASMPISIYGLGTREITMIGLLSIYNIAPENVVSLSLFWFVIIWIFPSVIGAGVTMLEGRENKKSVK